MQILALLLNALIAQLLRRTLDLHFLGEGAKALLLLLVDVSDSWPFRILNL